MFQTMNGNECDSKLCSNTLSCTSHKRREKDKRIRNEAQ